MPTDTADRADALMAAETWLRECSTWLLRNDLDMQCPMTTDPLDLADALRALATQKETPDAS